MASLISADEALPPSIEIASCLALEAAPHQIVAELRGCRTANGHAPAASSRVDRLVIGTLFLLVALVHRGVPLDVEV